MSAPACWQCNQPSEASLFCPSCNTLQPPTSDYYQFLGLERKLLLDEEDLQQRFYQLSRKLHPDRYMRKTPQERQHSLEATAILNDAYRMLRDPVSRAEYVLKEHGFDIGEQRTKDVPPELLEEVFELNMALEEMRMGDDSVRPRLEEARARFIAMRDELDGELRVLFGSHDSGQDGTALAAIRTLLNKRRYIRNLVGEVEKELASRQ